MFSLVIEKGEPAGAVYPLQEGESTLGRSRSATCRLQSPDVSGLHARLTVAAGTVRLENLSQFGTRLDGVPVTGVVPLQPGQRIAVGKVSVLVLREGGAASAPPARVDAEAATGEAPRPAAPPTRAEPAAPPAERPTAAAPAETRASAEPGATRAAATADDLSELTRAASGTAWGAAEEGATEGATRAMQTRAATPEEIEHLKESEQKRRRRRTTVGLAVAFPLVLLALIFRPRTPPPENEIEWAKDTSGDYADLFEPAPSGGFKEGGYDFCYPGNNTFKRKDTEGGMLLEGWIARNLDVPMRLILQEEQEVRFTAMDRAAAVEDWMAQASASGGRWNFDRPSPTPAFFGKKNGIPFTRVTYLRDGDGTWFGIASVFRHGCRRIVTRIEVPATERVRAEKMMGAKLIRPSEEFEFSYWEGAPAAAKLSEEEVLSQIRADVERIAPATWVALEGLLQGLLTQATQSGHKEVVAEATRLLVRLREREALWFNSQQFAFDAALMQNNWTKAAKIAEFTKAVFSNLEDQRYFTVRKWKATPQ